MKQNMMNSRATVLVLLSAMSALSGTAMGQLQPDVPPEDQGGILFAEGQIKFESLEHDFGRIEDGDAVDCEFKFTNTGSGLLLISNVHPGCGCTVTQMDKKEYKPGETGVIRARFDPKGKGGIQAKSITVTSNDRSSPQLFLTLKADIQQRVKMDPMFMTFEAVDKGVGAAKVVRVMGVKPDFSIGEIKVAPEGVFSGKVVGKPSKIKDGDREMTAVDVELSIRKDAPVGRHNASITFVTNDPKALNANIGVGGEVMGELTLSPARVSLGVVVEGTAFAGELKINRRDGKAFAVKATDLRTVAGQAVEVKIDTKTTSPDAVVLSLTGNAPMGNIRYTGELVVTTDVLGEETIRVPVYLTVRTANASVPVNPENSPVGKFPVGKPPVASPAPAGIPAVPGSTTPATPKK